MAGEKHSGWTGTFRTVAVFCAVMLVFAQSAQQGLAVSSPAWGMFSLWEGVTRWSVPALFMAWGMEDLEGGKGAGSWKKVLWGLGVLVFWGVLYALAGYLLGGGTLSLAGLGEAVAAALGGQVASHLWILFPLLGLRLVLPVLSRFAAGASRGEVVYILALAFLLAGVLPIWTNFHPNHVLVALTGRLEIHLVLGWAGYYLAGWFFSHYTIGRLEELILYVLGVLGLGLTLWGDRLVGGSRALWYGYTAPGVACTAAAVCVLLRYVLTVSPERARQSKVGRLGEFVVGVYLFHQIWVLVFQRLGVGLNWLPDVVYVPLGALILFVLSIPPAWLLSKLPVVGPKLTEG